MNRITVFEIPYDSSVYYAVEFLDADYKLKTIYESEIFEGIESIPEEEVHFENLIDITDKMLKRS